MNRRSFVATATGLGTTLLAGCSGGGGGGGGGGGSGGDDGDDSDGGSGGGGSGIFRLLISDQPAAIGDFDSLDVTLSAARVFRTDADEEISPATVTGTAGNETESDDVDETESDGNDEDDESEGESEGFVEFQLDGVTVDLTQVVGERAVSVLEDELDAGRYSGIELRVAGAEGVVDGETVDVMVPSERLRIVRPFEVTADEELRFVFDIKVVQKGPGGSYNLLPVIGKSGVAGEDVEVDEVDGEGDDESGGEGDEGGGKTETPDATETPGGDGGGGPPDEN